MALIDKASLLMVPSTYEAGKLYNVLPSGNRAPDSTDQNSGYDQTRADFDFDRGSNAAATRIGSDGLLKKYRENLLTQSNNFSHSDWNVKAGTFTQGVEDPDGGNNAWAWAATNTDPYLYQSGKSLTGVTTLSIWVKGVGSTIGASFQIRTGAAPYKNLTLTGDWQRVEHFNTNTSATSVGFEYGNPAVVGDVVHIYQAQYEAGTIATDYLDSTSVTAKAGVLIDLPRIDYSSGAGALLLEPQRANAIQYSEYFNASSWVKQNCTITSNYAISPEGVNNASRIVSSGIFFLYQLFTFTNAVEYTLSFYVKSNGSGNDSFRLYAEGNSATKTATNEWVRHEYTFTGQGTNKDFGLRDVGGSSLDILIWGAQVEQGSYATSYIPNMGESGGVTRAADSCKIAHGEGLPTDYPFVMYSEAEIDTTKGSRCILSFLNEAVGNNYFSLEFGVISGKFTAVNRSQAVIYRVDSSNTYSDGKHKIAILFSSSTHFKMYVDGAEAGEETHAASAFSSDIKDVLAGQLRVVSDTGTRHPLIQIGFFNEALSDSELATLTTL